MNPNPTIMGYMQPFPIAGAIAPIAPADMKGRISINDPAGFAALLGGTALTAPLVEGNARGITVKPAVPLPETPLSDGASSLPAGVALVQQPSGQASPDVGAVIGPATPPDGKTETAVADAASATSVRSRLRPGTLETSALPKTAPTVEALIAMSERPAQPDLEKAAPDKVSPDALAAAAAALASAHTPPEMATAPADRERAPVEDAVPQDQAMPAAVPQPVAAAIAPIAVNAAAPVQRGAARGQTELTKAAVPTVVPPVMDTRAPSALQGDAQSQIAGDDAGSAFEEAASDNVATDTAASQRSETTATHSNRATGAAPKDFASALDATAARAPTEAPRATEAKPPVQPQAQPQPSPDPVVRASAPGHDMGIALSRHAGKDGEQVVTLRLDPGELGRIEVRLAVDEDGRMTARISADQRHTLDLIRRDTDTLVRTLNDAGVRADAQGFRFDGGGTQSGGQHAAWAGHQGQQGQGNGRHIPFHPDPAFAGGELNDAPIASPAQPMGPATGRVDLLA